MHCIYTQIFIKPHKISFTVLCWAIFIAILSHMQPLGYVSNVPSF